MLATDTPSPATLPPLPAASARIERRRLSGLLSDVLGTLLVMALACVTRFPYLETVPRFRDETFNTLIALRIYRGQEFPFTDIEPYIGAFFNYAVAAGMFVIGPTIYAARTIVTWFGVAAVGAAYCLGREVGGRMVGLIAAGFMVTNGVHIAPMGHVAFSGSITPLFTTLGFWLLHRAVVRRSGWALAWAGFALGMGLHTHPTIVAFLPGALGWVLWHWRDSLRTRWPYVAALLFVVAFSPMIAYNVMTGGQSIRHAAWTATERGDYARGQSTELTPATYLERQQAYWLMVYGTLGGAVDERSNAESYLTDPLLVAASALAAAGLIWAARRGYALPLWLLGSFSLILPLANATHYDIGYDGRYIMPLLPLVYATMGLVTVDTARFVRGRLQGRITRLAVQVAISGLLMVLIAAPLFSLGRFYARGVKSEPTNASLVSAMAEATAALRPGDLMVVDGNLNDRKVEHASPWDEASTYRVFKYILEFENVPYETPNVDAAAMDRLAARQRPAVIILSSGFDSVDTNKLQDLIDRYRLVGLDGKPAKAPKPAERYRLVRFDPSRIARVSGGPAPVVQTVTNRPAAPQIVGHTPSILQAPERR
ncbi:MAG: glycosyltransferase family 39 protein [Chloroflexi bacterium]|nr:glycosyltransferase family 39 protein [Chloroflexota bacterium]